MEIKARGRCERLDLTEKNRQWLNLRFLDHNGVYCAHQPIWGYNKGSTESGHILRFSRTLNLLRLLPAITCRRSLLDVGAAEGYTAALVRRLMPSCRAVVTDLSKSLMHKANALFGLPACVANAADLPFADNSFDVVLSSEVLEHTANPFHVLFELVRVAREYAVITTEASLPLDLYRRVALKTRGADRIHYDRNIWVAGDFLKLFCGACAIYPQFSHNYKIKNSSDIREAKKEVLEMSAVRRVSLSTAGLIIIVSKEKSVLPRQDCLRDEEILDLLFSGPLANYSAQAPDLWSTQWLDGMVCSGCRKKTLKISSSQRVTCGSCHKDYGRDDGVLDFLPSEIVDYDKKSEKEMILKMAIDARQREKLLSLTDAFDEDNIEKNLIIYYIFRALRKSFRLFCDLGSIFTR